MKKSNVDAILVHDAEKRRTIISYILVIIAFLILALSFVLLSIHKNEREYITYKENSDISYKVYLKENDFFEKNYAEEEKQYIASLIDYIGATFNYNIDIDKKDVEYKYAYRIEAAVNVKEKGGTKSLFSFTESLLDNVEKKSDGRSHLTISENVKIDYNHYNDIIQKFISTYQLVDTESTLKVNMYVKAIGTCEDFENDQNEESVITLEIPLTTKTMAIDITNDLVETKDNIMLCKKENFYILYIIIAFIMLVVAIVYIVLLSLYIIKNKTAKDIYDKELKKILNNYHSYIQKINNNLDVSAYEKLYVDTFTDMLEIRDTLQQPILMVESKLKNGVHFIIPSNTKILYIYTLKVSDIKKKMTNENK